MFVRVIKRKLSTGHVRGDIVPGSTFAQLAALIRAGAVAEVKPPPLSELMGWTTRSVMLAEHGIVDVAQFIEADNEQLRQIMGIKRPSTIERYKAEVYSELLPAREIPAMQLSRR